MNSRQLLSLFCGLILSASAWAEGLPTVSFTDRNGETVTLESTQGTLRVINFWATWCPPCIKEMPSLTRLDQKLKPLNGQVIAINVGEQPDEVEAFMLERMEETEMKIWLDEPGRSFPAFKLTALPMTLIVDAEGQIIDRVLGGKEWDSDEVLNTLIPLVPGS